MLQGYPRKASFDWLLVASSSATHWCQLHLYVLASQRNAHTSLTLLPVYYGTQYFTRAGFQNPFIIQVITNSVNVASTFPGLYLVEKLGRRNLLLMGAIGMCICQFIVASVGTATPASDLPSQRASIAFVCIYIFFFASSWGPVAWVVTGELFPLKARAKCLSMTT